jgi:hypothetical protein
VNLRVTKKKNARYATMLRKLHIRKCGRHDRATFFVKYGMWPGTPEAVQNEFTEALVKSFQKTAPLMSRAFHDNLFPGM